MTSKCLFLTAKSIVLFELFMLILGSALIVLEHHNQNEHLHIHKNFSSLFPNYFAQCHLYIPYLILQLACAICLWFNHISAVIILVFEAVYFTVDYLTYYRTVGYLTSYWTALLIFTMFNLVSLWLSYQLYIMWKERRVIKKAQGEVQILFNKMNGDGGDDDDDDVVYKV